MRINSTFSRALVVCATLALTVGACGGTDADTASGAASSSTSAGSDAPEVNAVTIDGDLDNPVNELAAKAISDLQSYWAAEYPDLYGEDYRPVEGGFYGVIPSSGKLPPCAGSADDIAGNAYYCPSKDVIAWDAEGLLPDLRERFGDFVVPIVLAHEWGHAIQARSNFEGLTVTSEIQADCFAGVWAAHAIDDGVYDVNAAELDSALAGFLVLRDEPGTDSESESAHGSGFDRVNAFQNGFDDGATACKAYRDGTPAVVELPFNNAADAASGGNAPYDQIINGVPYDLEDYWSKLFPELFKKTWTPLQEIKPLDPKNPPACGDQSTEGYALFYCPADDYIGFDNVGAMPSFYERGGDFAVAALLATQYGIAGESKAGEETDGEEASLRADCFAGGWTASVLLGNRGDSSSYLISPGDLDEAIGALLLFRGDDDAERQGSGYKRVQAYRNGVVNGAQAC